MPCIMNTHPEIKMDDLLRSRPKRPHAKLLIYSRVRVRTDTYTLSLSYSYIATMRSHLDSRIFFNSLTAEIINNLGNEEHQRYKQYLISISHNPTKTSTRDPFDQILQIYSAAIFQRKIIIIILQFIVYNSPFLAQQHHVPF